MGDPEAEGAWREVRHQHPVGPFSLDFYAPALKLCIEVDGAAHDMGDNPQRDERRDALLLARNIHTIRIPATEVMRNLEGVYALILQECQSGKP